MIIEPFPLKWPKAYPVSMIREPAAFKCTMATARDGVLREIKLLGGKNPVINCNMTPNNKGLLTGDGYMMGSNPGVCVYFDYQGEQKFVACDAWRTVRDNVRAIELTIQSIRAMARHKCTNIVSQALGDQRMLAASNKPGKDWWTVLEVQPSTHLKTIKEHYYDLAKKYHPDNASTGDKEKFVEIQEAYEQALTLKEN